MTLGAWLLVLTDTMLSLLLALVCTWWPSICPYSLKSSSEEIKKRFIDTLRACSPDCSLQESSFMPCILKPRGDWCSACPTFGIGVGQAGAAGGGGACAGGGRTSCQSYCRAGKKGPATSADRSSRRKRCPALGSKKAERLSKPKSRRGTGVTVSKH